MMANLRVWSAARVSEVVPPPPPQAATNETSPSAPARERNKALRVIPPPTKHGSRSARTSGILLPRIHRHLPGCPGRECAAVGSWPSSDGHSTLSYVLNFIYPK